MKVLITGVCGFVGSSIARHIVENKPHMEVVGLDNFLRSGSWTNKAALNDIGVKVVHGDIRQTSDLNAIGKVDWIIEAAAVPSVLGGVDGSFTPHQVLQHNLVGTMNLADFARSHLAGVVFLSSSRVYSIETLQTIKLKRQKERFTIDTPDTMGDCLSERGITEIFSTAAPISFYGTSKLASENILLEYSEAYDMPVYINRCGVLAGAGQFAMTSQGIVPFWIHSWKAHRPLKYVGFQGEGLQVRDCLHPTDLAKLVLSQIECNGSPRDKVINVSGGQKNSFSLKELSSWCVGRFGDGDVSPSAEERPYDLPWLVLDHSLASLTWGWNPSITKLDIFEEIARFAETNPKWIDLCQ